MIGFTDMENGSAPKIGFIGQGFIGKNYADDFERRGHPVVRYTRHEYAANKDAIGECDIVFIAVPTPTTPEGFDDSSVRSAIALTRPGASVVVKSTMIPGTTEKLQEAYPDRIVMHSPEFLREANAAEDAANPERNVVGIPKETPEYRAAAETVLAVLPDAPFELICSAREAELIKYGGNVFLMIKVLYANLFFDLAEKMGCDWDRVREAVGADSRIGPSHLKVLHTSGHPGAAPGRGAGGHCFIKDFAAWRALYEQEVGDATGVVALKALEQKNIELLTGTGKDLDLLKGVYGDTLAR